jgi:hypothetical protein
VRVGGFLSQHHQHNAFRRRSKLGGPKNLQLTSDVRNLTSDIRTALPIDRERCAASRTLAGEPDSHPAARPPVLRGNAGSGARLPEFRNDFNFRTAGKPIGVPEPTALLSTPLETFQRAEANQPGPRKSFNVLAGWPGLTDAKAPSVPATARFPFRSTAEKNDYFACRSNVKSFFVGSASTVAVRPDIDASVYFLANGGGSGFL